MWQHSHWDGSQALLLSSCASLLWTQETATRPIKSDTAWCIANVHVHASVHACQAAYLNGLCGTISVLLPQMETKEQLMPQLDKVLLTRREQRMLTHGFYASQILEKCRGYVIFCSETNDVRCDSPALCGRAAAARVRWARKQPNVIRKGAGRKLSAAARNYFR